MKKIHNGELFNQTTGLDVTATGGYSARKQPIKSRLGEALLGSWNPAGSIPLDQAVDAAAGRGRGTEPGGLVAVVMHLTLTISLPLVGS